jgi:hypothetical protein
MKLATARARSYLCPALRVKRSVASANFVLIMYLHHLTTALNCVYCTSSYTKLTGRRCQFSFERVSFELKWLTQLVNHIAHSAFFVWPLIAHLKAMKAANASGAGLDRNRTVYKRLASRALTATILSTLFTGTFYRAMCVSIVYTCA